MYVGLDFFLNEESTEACSILFATWEAAFSIMRRSKSKEAVLTVATKTLDTGHPPTLSLLCLMYFDVLDMLKIAYLWLLDCFLLQGFCFFFARV